MGTLGIVFLLIGIALFIGGAIFLVWSWRKGDREFDCAVWLFILLIFPEGGTITTWGIILIICSFKY